MTMELCVGRLIRKQHKIANRIIKFIFIDMMDNLFGLKVSTKMFFHNKPRLTNISIYIGRWMIFLHNKNISIGYGLSSIPSVIFIATSRFAHFVASCFRKFYSLSSYTSTLLGTIGSFSFRWNRIKNISARWTHFFYSWFYVPGDRHNALFAFIPRCYTFFKGRFRNNIGMFTFVPRDITLNELSTFVSHKILPFDKMDCITLRGDCQEVNFITTRGGE